MAEGNTSQWKHSLENQLNDFGGMEWVAGIAASNRHRLKNGI